MSNIKEGYVQIYTGDGKGKTTAAIGLGIRAAGNDMVVYMVQFLKNRKSGEIKSINKLGSNFKVYNFEKEKGFFWTLNEEEKKELKYEINETYKFCIETIKNNRCDILILDEIMGALTNKLLNEQQIIDLIEIKPRTMEIIMTGRNVPEAIINKADLVTEMKEIKHYFNKGVPAREGIEY